MTRPHRSSRKQAFVLVVLFALVSSWLVFASGCSKKKGTEAVENGASADNTVNAQSGREGTIDERLFAAVKASDAKAVARLLAEGANPDAVDTHGAYPLYHAAHDGSRGCVTALLNGGANVDGNGVSDWTPLQEAIHIRFHGSSIILKIRTFCSFPAQG